MIKGQKDDRFRVMLYSEPAVLGQPESTIEQTISFVHDAVLYWAKNKGRMIQGL
jgi:hypothetical protein